MKPLKEGRTHKSVASIHIPPRDLAPLYPHYSYSAVQLFNGIRCGGGAYFNFRRGRERDGG